MKRITIGLLIALGAMAQQIVTLTAVAPPPVQNLGAGVVGTAGTVAACYWVVVNYVGGAILSASPTCLANVPGTLSSSNYVLLTWQASTGTSVTYDVLKTTTNTPPGAGATVGITTGLTSPTYSDQGGSLSPYTLAAFPYSTSSMVVRLNNRDYNPPAFEYVGSNANPIQGAFGVEVPKGSGTDQVLRLGSRTSPFTIDANGAAYMTEGSGAPGAAVGTTVAGVLYSTSANVTVAQVNAGYTLLPAVTGQTYKLEHVFLQALGGATAGCTLVEIADTAGTPIVGVAVAVAALTQNTVVTEYTPTTVTLTTFAPTALTASKGIQIIKTGSSCTTATSFNVIVAFTINS